MSYGSKLLTVMPILHLKFLRDFRAQRLAVLHVCHLHRVAFLAAKVYGGETPGDSTGVAPQGSPLGVAPGFGATKSW